MSNVVVLIALFSLWPALYGSVQIVNNEDVRFEPTWDSLDSRNLPEWYEDAKFGIFIHWGVFSVPSFGTEWFWSNWKIDQNENYTQFMENNFPPAFTYQEFASDFSAEFFDPEQWADLFNAAGAKYIVFTSKHHEGYTMWPSKNSFGWNAKDVGPGRDLLGDLASAVRNRTEIKFGLYHSLYEWFNPLYLDDKQSNFSRRSFVESKTMPELYDLVMTYRPEIVWSDGDWDADDDYWDSRQFIAWLYNDSPVKTTVVTNDRWGRGTLCKHGDFYTCADRYSPGTLQLHKWENCLTIDRKSWGFRRNSRLDDYLSIEELLEELVKTVSCGGNLLVNVGPTKEGTITPIFEERLRQLGSWLSLHGEAIYGSRPWTYQNDTLAEGVWYTSADNVVYASVLSWPQDDLLTLAAPKLSNASVVSLISYDTPLSWIMDNRLSIQFPNRAEVKAEWAFVLAITNVVN